MKIGRDCSSQLPPGRFVHHHSAQLSGTPLLFRSCPVETITPLACHTASRCSLRQQLPSPGPEPGGLQHEAAPGRRVIAPGYGSGAGAGVEGCAREYRGSRQGVRGSSRYYGLAVGYLMYCTEPGAPSGAADRVFTFHL